MDFNEEVANILDENYEFNDDVGEMVDGLDSYMIENYGEYYVYDD